ncbi:uncharacterized protein [Amphiura filiformis]|uniref:uncharacterized protein n=1 Tax=Amphiura filiformis TaxID=82378 RepID=UPI003B20E296
MEPESMCFSACDCSAPPDKKRMAIAKCTTEDCTCKSSRDKLCPMNARQICTFEDGVFCEYGQKYCVNQKDMRVDQCECKPGWTGPGCDICDGCHDGGSPSNNRTAMVLGSLLVIVVLVLILLIIIYWRLGRLPCHKEKPQLKTNKTGKPLIGNAYSVSAPMPITRQDMPPGKSPGISPQDRDTGEIENEYAYAAINEYATVGSRDNNGRPAVPTAPVPSVSAAKAAETPPYYFRLAENSTEQTSNEMAASTTSSATTTTTTTADCYTKVIKKPKEENPKPPISQYDRLDRINFRPPPSVDNASPSDNNYGTLSSSLASDGSPPV